MNNKMGFSEGDTCNRMGCKGIIQEHSRECCSCHIHPPCSSCTAPVGFCSECGWEESEDEPFNDHIINVSKETGIIRTYTLRPLDSTKIDWHSIGHTHSAMIKRGVYPEGITREEVSKQVKGTFGGRFNSFGNGKFEYVAYTD